MYSKLPRSLKAECLVKSTVEDEDEGVMRERRELVKNATPAELSRLHGLSDFPMPSALENIFKEKPTAPSRKKGKDDEKRK